MSRQGTAATGWSSTQAYVMAVICLLIGMAVGYFLRGSDAARMTQTTPTAAPANVPFGQQQVTPEQLKHMADKQAEPLLTRLKSTPKDPVLLANIGNVYYDAQQYNDAINYYQQSLQYAPNDPNVITDMATCYWYLGDADKALAGFDRSLKINPTHAGTLFNVGIVKWQGKGDIDGAVAAWQKLLDTNPGYPDRDRVKELIARAKQHANILPGQKTDKPTM
ncbi:MAG: tetratricopeptide repeat protein [Terriglobales bacterium]